jgi:thiol-disulfide isomerase/thioredoxin
MSFASKGNFNMKENDLGNGKKEIILYRKSIEETETYTQHLRKNLSKWIDKPFPNFKLFTLAGRKISNADLRGNITVINFWFNRCAPCVEEMPKLNQLMYSYSGQPVNFYAITFNDKETVLQFIGKNDFFYTQIPDARQLLKELGIEAYPAHMILDTNGVVKEIEIGGDENIDDKLKILIESARHIDFK